MPPARLAAASVDVTTFDAATFDAITAEAPVLPSRHRMRSSAEFTAVVRRGLRARRGSVVVHLLPGAALVTTTAAVTAASGGAAIDEPAADPARIGLIVGKTVGGSVVRHRVSRRLRAQLAARLPLLPDGARVAVRALPEAATADSAQLGSDLDAALARLLRDSR